MEADQRREWMKSRRKMRKAARGARLRRQTLRFMLLCGLLFCGGACFTHMPWSVHNEKTQIVLRGNSVASKEQVLKLLGSAMDVPIYRLDPKQLEKQLASLKAVRYAFVRRYALPQPKLVVEVLEEYPWASFSTDPKMPPVAVIAQSGRFIPIKDFPNVVKPHMVIYANPNFKLTSREVTQWASWANYITEQTGRPVDSIDMRQPFDVRIQNGDLALKLGMPDTTLTRRLGRLVSILPTVETYVDRLEYIDLGLDNSIPLKVSKKPIKRLDDKQQTAAADLSTGSTSGSATASGAMTATAMRGASATLSVPSGSNANISGSTAGIVSGSTTINQQTASSPNGQPL
ncbi:MAG: FtsQ-type POTRA domain-containing protein [Candidatus Obscuribacter sp.]|jgi:cell division septal protein FtsQ|nr:FtsQ-type POTRA domain-containing protein [Candidatus Obscuribacter sp.]MBL0188029.1 FtsQ-type POTRA domain-containing protein [Candidatus Obscuribacter sp.]MBP6594048.1 FtsQ-type POTRA domain-containing protein [Candidatus Obscuribacter sp.]MBP7576525.1 FtsQ-type POTRA domain-containing protein [Candidatus Obscuribacter sp.]